MSEPLDLSLRYAMEEKAVFFPVIDRSDSEIVMAEDDKHLYFRTSVFIEKTLNRNRIKVYVTTLVQFHNVMGNIYSMPVKPFHKMIIRTQLKNFMNTIQE